MITDDIKALIEFVKAKPSIGPASTVYVAMRLEAILKDLEETEVFAPRKVLPFLHLGVVPHDVTRTVRLPPAPTTPPLTMERFRELMERTEEPRGKVHNDDE
jgi:hypothetical protein